MSEIIWASAHETADRIARGELTAREVTAAHLEQTRALEPTLRSFITVDEDVALRSAERADERVAAGEPLGPLHGVPIGIKDNLWTADLPTTGGSRVYADFVPPSDGLPVARLRAAGAVIFGKTHMPEFAAWPRTVAHVQGDNCNPWDPTRITGASSGGSGSAVAAAQVPVALGTDGGGSTRLPAALNGVVGVQPSRGVVPAWGQVGYGAFGAVGPMTRSVRDAARILTVISGPDERDPSSAGVARQDYEAGLDDGVEGVRLVWLDGMGEVEPDRAVGEVVRDAVDDLEDAGCRVVERHDSFAGLEEHFVPLNLGNHRYGGGRPGAMQEPEVRAAFASEQRDELLTPYIVASMAGSPRITPEQWERSTTWVEDCRRRLDALFEDHGFVVCPTAPYVAPPVPADPWSMPFETMGAYIANTGLVNLLRLTAVSVPAGFVDGLPVGLQIIGPQGSEAGALRVARALELARPWEHVRPRLATTALSASGAR
ncbi:amidase/aspartyl-tRNA(Asn)/glutamyl-tRNA(Gln) amidotransferase subunit A [Sediminihabitans luteus]|uniref:Amidase/aspartyl-tRNA(Asn)/glutamyl-tRNA(Gln) amidotransferase subunit A n=1 Tax=Sediminihabitans luteus TaxID=1138585 RepID=A0A2M9CYN0_9CELL|nr:amidase [Sediminihabitans luteus]PJJ76848.1 amidase/aspartyl-tRNA(Asn)/glutamyl-tRNA(Gln) amidotransferase subunit A [Sediminihabitans luteus]GIJ00327.1 glutamyl-tRNA(Gln) amidotransferase subunit A [Sediminihabitans luteus]